MNERRGKERRRGEIFEISKTLEYGRPNTYYLFLSEYSTFYNLILNRTASEM